MHVAEMMRSRMRVIELEAEQLVYQKADDFPDDPGPEVRDALLQKHAWWESNAEMHDVTTEGPYVFGDQFAIRYSMDVTFDGDRSQMSEVGVYTVKDDKIVEERFFYGADSE